MSSNCTPTLWIGQAAQRNCVNSGLIWKVCRDLQSKSKSQAMCLFFCSGGSEGRLSPIGVRVNVCVAHAAVICGVAVFNVIASLHFILYVCSNRPIAQ